MAFDLTKYKALSFDIYATLIDWETGIYNALSFLLSRLPSTSPNSPLSNPTPSPLSQRKFLLAAFTRHESALQIENPKWTYNKILANVLIRVATELGVTYTEDEAVHFSDSVASWPAFDDTVEAMQELAKHYKLIVLSNVDHTRFRGTLSGPLNGVDFDAIYTAEDIGSYKPDLGNFEYLIENVHNSFGIQKHEILHVAQSLTHDHVPAKSVGLSPGVWIRRAGGDSAIGGSVKELADKIELGIEFDTLGEMAEAVRDAFRER
ncbi:hypothetical protein BP6252_13334 [Coleophoma cylindrospora]|uniref:Haloacid dehalogenase n=1 Tax=Coleophoma cylindrospora TaxID=1849047 RepID=A0A3D8QB79_9HELO|nr:hypothetical protein BP6252_13334 [Coleophoma cylindrospora]